MIIHKLIAFIGAVTVLGLMSLMYPSVASSEIFKCEPVGEPKVLDISNFILSQGNTMVFSDVASDQLGWNVPVDKKWFCTNFARVDYTGQNTKELLPNLEVTEVTGYVTQQACKDSDRSIVNIESIVRNPVSWAQSCKDLLKTDFDFANTEVIYGGLPREVQEGTAVPAIEGWVVLKLTITLDPNAPDILVDPDQVTLPLPDLSAGNTFDDDTGTYAGDGHAPKEVSIDAMTFGPCKNGKECYLRVIQEAKSDDTGEKIFTTEVVDVREIKRNSR